MKIARSLVVLLLFLTAFAAALRHSILFEHQYPLSAHFVAPHRGTMATILDRLWFATKPPEILHRIIPVVYAQTACQDHNLTCQAVANSPCENGCVPWVCKLTGKDSTCTNGFGTSPCQNCQLCH
jgi:hypothetical protein